MRLYVSFRMLRSIFNVVSGNTADIWFGVIHDCQENSQGYDIKAPRLATHLLDWLLQGDSESLRCSKKESIYIAVQQKKQRKTLFLMFTKEIKRFLLPMTMQSKEKKPSAVMKSAK